MRYSRARYVGLDMHKESIAVAYAREARYAEVVFLGRIGTRQSDIDTRIRTLTSKATQLVFVYEAGPCEYWLYRDLSRKKLHGWVVAPLTGPEESGRPRQDRST